MPMISRPFRPSLTVAIIACLLLLPVLASMAMASVTPDAGSQPGLWSGLLLSIQELQKDFHDSLTASLKEIHSGGGIMAGTGLIFASFLYGVFHAAGPGHGKVILSTWLLTTREDRKKAIFLALASAFCQGLTAILVVGGLVALAGWLPRDTASATLWGERVAYIALFLVALYPVWRGCKQLWSMARQPAPKSHEHGHKHEHEHHDGHGQTHDHHHHHHGENCGCGHDHMPDMEKVRNSRTIWARAGIILSIGLRPCSGAILVLLLARAMDLFPAGIAAVMAMSLGTGIAVSLLAFLATGFRGKTEEFLSSRKSGRSGGISLRAGLALLSVAGGLFLVFLAFSLLVASFPQQKGPAAPRHPLGLQGRLFQSPDAVDTTADPGIPPRNSDRVAISLERLPARSPVIFPERLALYV